MVLKLQETKMVKQILRRILERRHFWRDSGFDELSELYVSNMLRVFALSVLMVFIPFYMYQHDYAIVEILATFGFFFACRVVMDIVAGYFVARFGPKHSILVSNGLQIISAALFLTLPAQHWPIWLLGSVYGAAASFFFVAFHVEFSKIKHSAHVGTELGHMQMFEKIAAIAGPLVGGFAGAAFGSPYIFVVASLVLIASLWPLFRSAEPVRTHQQLQFRMLPLGRVKRDVFVYAALGVENTLCINLWPLYLSLFALGENVYAKLGALTSLAVLVSIAAAKTIGRWVDDRNARSILRISALLNALVYICRPFVSGLAPALVTNVVNEVVTTGYRLPFTKGMYAAADELPGFRIVYVSSLECIASIAKGTAWFLLALLSTMASSRHVLVIGFMIAGIASLCITCERFRALGTR